MNEHVAKSFEYGFMSQSLSRQIAGCDSYELAPLFRRLLPNYQPVLEAGCGSGRWCAWFGQRGIASDGVDWSRELCDRAASEISGSRFIACDMQHTPFADASYGSIVALGSVEHVSEGPATALAEFRRVLRPGGVAVITVPYGGPLRRSIRWLGRLALALKASPRVRRLFDKPLGGRTLREARRGCVAAWFPRFGFDEEGWAFYEYEFNRHQMRGFMDDAGFGVVEEFVAFGNEGILQNFGRAAGRWDAERGDVAFTLLGRLLRRIIPVTIMGHMLVYVVLKKD